MSKEIKALGSTVIIKSIAKSAGSEIKTESGVLLGIRQVGEVPLYGEIFKIGPNVPKGLFDVGDQVPIPLCEKLNVPHPDVLAGVCEPKDRDDKYIAVHFTGISCVYK